MTNTIVSQNGSSLLGYAISRLSPEIFLHPAWVRFGPGEASDTPNLIPNLMGAAKNLEKNDPSAACQILLICAVYQNRAGQSHNAVITIQQALALARRTNLRQETTWAIWGACAIFVQQGNLEQAASLFVDLQAVLSEQDEWILANYVDVLRQTFFQPEVRHAGHQARSLRDKAVEDLITPTLDWFQHWGITTRPEAEFEVATEDQIIPAARQLPTIQPAFPTQPSSDHWHTLMLAIRGELRLQWTRSDSRATKKEFSLWGAILRYLDLYIHRKHSDGQAPDNLHEAHSIASLPLAKEESPPPAPKSRKKTPAKRAVSRKNQRSKRVPDPVHLIAHTLGTFRITIGDVPMKIPSSRNLSLFKYLLMHHKQKIPREVLMDVFWPDAEPETARNSLNVAIHNLRQSIRTFTDLPLIVFESGSYGVAPSLQVWMDVEEFERAHKTGHRLETLNQLTAAIAEYECAVSLYQGDFLEENPYEEWTVLDRERLRVAYLDTLDRLSQIYFRQERYSACRSACQLILASDCCREDAHCLLMRCYSRQGQYPLALQQYQRCVEALHAELDVEPAPETTQLYEAIRRRERV